MAETGYLLTVALVTPLSSYFKRKLKVAYHLPYRNRALHHRLPDGSLHVELSYADDRANTTGSGHGNRASVDVQYHS